MLWIWFVFRWAQCIWCCGAFAEKKILQIWRLALAVNIVIKITRSEAYKRTSWLLPRSEIKWIVIAVNRMQYVYMPCKSVFAWCLHIAHFGVVLSLLLFTIHQFTNSCWMLNVWLNRLHNSNKKTNRFGFVWAPWKKTQSVLLPFIHLFYYAHFNLMLFVYCYSFFFVYSKDFIVSFGFGANWSRKMRWTKNLLKKLQLSVQYWMTVLEWFSLRSMNLSLLPNRLRFEWKENNCAWFVVSVYMNSYCFQCHAMPLIFTRWPNKNVEKSHSYCVYSILHNFTACCTGWQSNWVIWFRAKYAPHFNRIIWKQTVGFWLGDRTPREIATIFLNCELSFDQTYIHCVFLN